MKLALITQRYPYNETTEFVDDEMPYICECFEQVVIFSMAGLQTVRHPLPENCRAIRVPTGANEQKALLSWPRLLTPHAVGELIFAVMRLKKRNVFHCLKRILFYEHAAPLLRKSILSACLDPKDTLFLSYWCSEGAYALALLKKEGKIEHAVSRAHGYDCFIERDYIPYRREVLSHLDEIVCVSEAGRESIENRLLKFVPEKRAGLSVSRLGVFSSDDKMNPHRKSTEGFHIVSCSSMVRIKRLDLLVDALSLIDTEKIQWTHFGSGELRNDTIKRAEKKLSGKPNIRFRFAGAVCKDEVLSFYANHPVELFVNCSDYEGIPVSIMEALSFGIPVLARNVGGISEIVQNENGMLLEADCDPETLSAAICKFLALSFEEREKKAWRALDVCGEKCNAEANHRLLYRRLSQIPLREE